MIHILGEWVKQITMVILFASFTELLLPNSHMQRFVKLIMGLLIMYAMLNPITEVLQAFPQIFSHSQTTETKPTEQAPLKQNNELMIKKTETLTAEVYQKDLAKQVKALVLANEGILDAQVFLDLKQQAEEKNKYKINKMTIYIQPGSDEKSGDIKKVARISIGKALSNTPDGTQNSPDSKLCEKIRKPITELFQLSESQIEIKLLSNTEVLK